MRRYLDDWLVQSSSRESLLWDLQTILGLCHELGVVINREKSHLVSSQVVQYLGVVINTQSFVASPSPDQIFRLLSTAGEFRSSASPPARLWLSLLGMLSSLAHLVPGGRLRMRSLQLCLNRSWDHVDLLIPVAWSAVCLQDLQWWLHLPRLSQGVSLRQVSRLLVRRLGRRVGCSSGSPRRFRPLGLGTGVSIHQRQGAAGHPAWSPPLSVVSTRPYSRGLLRQRHCGGVSPQGRRHQISFAEHHSSGDPALVGVSSHPSGSTVYPGLQQRPGGRSVSTSPAASFRVVPQHDRISVFMSSMAGPNLFVCDLRQSPLLDLFFSLPRPSVGGHGRLPPVLGRSTGLRLSSICHHSQSPRETPGISGDRAHPCGSTLGSAPLVSGSPPAVAGPSGHPSRSSRPPAPASLSAPLPGSPQARSPQATASCLETLRRFTRAAGFSSAVAEHSSLARRLPAPLVCLPVLVPFSWPFRLSPFAGESG